MQIHPLGAERTGRHDEANSRFLQFCQRAQNLPPKMMYSLLDAVKDDLGLKTPDMFNILFDECGQVCVGQTGSPLRPWQYNCHTWLAQFHKSAEAYVSTDHHIQIQGVKILSTKRQYVNHPIYLRPPGHFAWTAGP